MLNPDKEAAFTKEQWEFCANYEGEVTIGEDPAKREARLARKRESNRRWDAKNLEKKREHNRKWRAANTEKESERCRRWRAANPENVHTRHLRNKYGITQEIYDRMLAQQGGKCYLCEKPPSGKKPLCVDHCHTSGHVRGLLCAYCNTGLGHIERPDGWLQKALGYIEAHKERFLDD